MAKINLLPWREERREELKKEFLTILGLVAVAGLLLVFIADRITNSRIGHQQARNTYLQRSITQLTEQVTEISELEQRREDLLDRMKIIQDLQGNRPVIVRVFDELVRTVPDDLYYNQVSRVGDKVAIEGVAKSSNRVSSLMRSLDSSDWFSGPNLTGVKANPNYGDQGNDFKLTVHIDTPTEDDSKESNGSKK